MKNLNVLRANLPIVLTALGLASAHAASQQTYVSVNGTDNTSCAADAPCRHLQAAVTNTAAGGSVLVVNSGDFGPVYITRSVRILASAGTDAVIMVDKSANGGSGRGVLIEAPGANVQLRGLTIRDGGGGIAVQVRDANALGVEGCEISGFAHKGVYVTAQTAVHVLGTTFRNNFTAVDSSARSLRIDGSTFVSNQTAVYTDQATRIDDTSVTGDASSEFGVVSHAPNGREIRIDVERSTLTGTAVAFYSHTEGTTGSVLLDVKDTVLSGNGKAFYAEGPSGSVIAMVDGQPIAVTTPAVLTVQAETSDEKKPAPEQTR